MAIYLITGRLGSGKTLCSVGRIRDAILAGRRVVTNLDIRIDKLLYAQARKIDLIRIPDKPCAADLEAIGIGTESRDEERNGLIVLDELGSWLNARQWADKERQRVIDWLIHSRKRGWDVMFICQAIGQVDKQVRESLVEYLVVCRRMDRMKIPLLGGLIRFCSGGLVSGHMPRVHMAAVRYGTAPDAILADRWVYMGRDLYPAYDTRQIFRDDYDNGPYSLLSPWHLVGRHSRVPTAWERFKRTLGFAVDDQVLPYRSTRWSDLQATGRAAARLRRMGALPEDVRWSVARDLARIQGASIASHQPSSRESAPSGSGRATGLALVRSTGARPQAGQPGLAPDPALRISPGVESSGVIVSGRESGRP